MKQYNIKSVNVTIINKIRYRIITKEATENYLKGKKNEKDSFNDDLETLFEHLRLGKKLEDKEVNTYFSPKLTEEELDLVERKDSNYMQTFYDRDPDVRGNEMLFSESDSKFIQGIGYRTTFKLEISSSKNISRPIDLHFLLH